MKLYDIISRMEREMEELRKAIGLSMMRRRPACDIIDEDDKIILFVDLPGFSKNDIDVEIGENYVKIKAEEKKEEKRRYLVKERMRSFYRYIELPASIKENEAKAKFRNGVLEITLPKKEGKKGKKIKIE
ncbi:MAG: Hsp20/alpha crystallin family protein [Thermoplasmata archaeon]|jgi:HSP20 family protein|nr:MAG: Hsp20/alpha crystallin family protein [Thermoplasmata archaeon]HDN96097.1 Hsp20/alpha crystallin family protein [Thermoplasmatales archaeon]